MIEPSELELTSLPSHLKYIFLGKDETLPIIISTYVVDKDKLSQLQVLSKHMKAKGSIMIKPDDEGDGFALALVHTSLNMIAGTKLNGTIDI